MKKYLLLSLFTLALTPIFAQSPLGRGGSQFNAGVGLSGYGIPVFVGFDYGIHEDVTIGGDVTFRTWRDRYSGYTWRYTGIGVSVNGNYHFNTLLNIPQQWDFYAGLNLGFYFWNVNEPNDFPGRYDEPLASGVGLGAQIGGRYYFTDRFGLLLELNGGTGLTGCKFGISYKL